MISQSIVRSLNTGDAASMSEGSPAAILSSLLGALSDHRSRSLMAIPKAAPRSRALFEHIIEVIESSERLFLAELCQAMLLEERADPRRRGTVEIGNTLEHLTERELQVAHLAAQGLINKEIAKRLVVSQSTVNSHLKHVFVKLNVHNRAQLVRALDLLDGGHVEEVHDERSAR